MCKIQFLNRLQIRKNMGLIFIYPYGYISEIHISTSKCPTGRNNYTLTRLSRQNTESASA
nr:MAG TPA_asm: hypothetical protein [Caudoviricetes sp.]